MRDMRNLAEIPSDVPTVAPTSFGLVTIPGFQEYTPGSIAVIGCTTGNGFEHIDGSQTHRVVGVDINPAYLMELKARFAGKIPCLQLIEADVSSADLRFEPVSLVFAGLIFEYVDVMEALNNIYKSLVSGGILITVLQLPSFESSPVTATRYKSLELLEPIMNLIPPSDFSGKCNSIGLKKIKTDTIPLKNGKAFFVGTFKKPACESQNRR
jgi:SAM-dependent methyltransferase